MAPVAYEPAEHEHEPRITNTAELESESSRSSGVAKRTGPLPKTPNSPPSAPASPSWRTGGRIPKKTPRSMNRQADR